MPVSRRTPIVKLKGVPLCLPLCSKHGDGVKQTQRWGPPGWPWELELLALVFVITAIAVPYYLQFVQTPEPSQMSLVAKAEVARRDNMATWQDLEGFFWAVVIVGLYLVHLAMASGTIDFMSTPFTHLFAPLVFSMITYYRLYRLPHGPAGSGGVVSGTLLEVLIWIAGVLIITYLVARIRMARLMLSFKDLDWQVSTRSLFDSTYSQLAMQVRPLIYPPHFLRACDQGILVEGWFYAMPIPFDSVTAIDAVQGSAFLSSGYCLATSLRSLVRIQISEKAEPILISPKDRSAFVHYCQARLAAKKPTTRAGETRSGATATASGTRKTAGGTAAPPG